jgi:hypothetical protein
MRIAWLVMLLFPLPVGSGYAAMGEIPLTALVDQAEVIVQGRVGSILAPTQSRDPGSGQKREIDSVVSNVADLKVSKVLKGPAGIRQLRIGFTSMEDSPRYKTGETVVVFLKRAAEEDFYTTVGMLQGKYVIENGRVEGEGVPVTDFLRRIEALAHRSPAPGR